MLCLLIHTHTRKQQPSEKKREKNKHTWPTQRAGGAARLGRGGQGPGRDLAGPILKRGQSIILPATLAFLASEASLRRLAWANLNLAWPGLGAARLF